MPLSKKEVLHELSKDKLHAYRDEARLTDLPDKLRPDHLEDQRTETEKNRRKKGIQNATDKLQKIHKDSAISARLARKDKPAKPKKPDSRMTLRKASKLGSLWTENREMTDLSNLSPEKKKEIVNRIKRDALKSRHRTKESHKMSVKDINRDKKEREYYKDWDNHAEDISDMLGKLGIELTEEQLTELSRIEEGNKENKVKKNAHITSTGRDIMKKQMFSHARAGRKGEAGASYMAKTILSTDRNNNATEYGKVGYKRVGRAYNQSVKEETQMENLVDVLLNLGVEMTEEQITEITKAGKAIHGSDMRKMKHELDARDHEGRGDWAAAKKSWKNAGLSAIKGDAARGRNTNLALQIRGKSIKDDIGDLLDSLGIELTEDQMTQLNTYTEETDMELTNEEIIETGPAIILSSIASESEDSDEIFDTILSAKVETLLDNLRMEMAAGMFADDEEEVEEVTTEDFVEAFAEIGITLSEEQIEQLETEEIEDILTEEQLDELKKSTMGSYIRKAFYDIASDGYKKGLANGAAIARGDYGKNENGTKKLIKRSNGVVNASFKMARDDTAEYLASIGVELTEEQLDELKKSTVASYKSKLPMSIAKDAGNAVEAGKIGRTGTQKRLEHRALKRVSTVSKMLSPKAKAKCEDVSDYLASIGVELTEEQLNELGKMWNPPAGFKKTGVQDGKPLPPTMRKGAFVSTKPKPAPKPEAPVHTYPRPVPGKKS